MLTQPPGKANSFNLKRYHISQQQTETYPSINLPTTPPPLLEDSTTTLISAPEQSEPDTAEETADRDKKKHKYLRILAIAIVLILAFALYMIWRPTSSAPTLTQQNISSHTTPQTNNTTNTDASNNTTGGIQAYIAGAVQHPGVYTLDINARVYQLIEAAGGSLPNANLAALNLAAKLNDGQEIYVARIGETPPASTSGTANNNDQTQLVNINTASLNDLRQQLHLSNKSAQAIITYRLQHGPFTSVNDLLKIISQSIYDKIKGMVTT